ncbi:queuosine precursor transporter [Schaalia sp. ZJ405]|uniref:queuosine precursor transporter n=1 Tax=Schaalia sp. ZJ405 TaxID=2709403 RepID=UPI0013EB12E2|nr:queuosine precursor transporter [Schaalia sp. ZJ405]QPK82228.1 queuosine precursor transporter [Schaalia sp. ZJ405]
MNATIDTETPVSTQTQTPRILDIIAVMFVAFLLISNIAGTKVTALDWGPIHLVFDGGAILFPLTYILGDVLSEVYGFKRARRVIFMGFAASIIASLTFWIVQISPVGPGYENQAAFEAVLGFVPRIVLASITGYLIGQLVNAFVLVKIREKWGKNHLWARLVGSTLVGEFVDTLLFCTIAFFGVIPGMEFLNYIVTGYVYKVGVEIVLLPITYRVISWVRRREGLAKDEVLAA